MVATKWVQPSQIWWNVVSDDWMFGTLELKQSFLSRFLSQRVPGWCRGTKTEDFPKPRFQLVMVFRCVSFIAPKNNERNLQKRNQVTMIWIWNDLNQQEIWFISLSAYRPSFPIWRTATFDGLLPTKVESVGEFDWKHWKHEDFVKGVEVYCWWLKSS